MRTHCVRSNLQIRWPRFLAAMFDVLPMYHATPFPSTCIAMTYEMLIYGLRTARRWVAVPLSLFLVAALTVACDPGAAVNAQDTDDPVQDAAPSKALVASATKAATESGLTEEQSASIRSILEDAEPAPGVLWTVAGAIHREIGTEATQAYAESLRPERPRQGMRRGERGGPRGARGFQRGGPRGERMLDELNLTGEQEEQISDIRSSYRAQMRDLRSGRGRPSPETREEMQSLRNEMRGEIHSVLTDEQRAELDAMRAERMKMRAERRSERQAARNEALGLTDEQAEQMSALRDEARAARQSGDRFPRQEMRDAAAEILTEDQQAIAALHRSLMMNVRAELTDERGPRRGGRRGGGPR